MTDIWAYCSKCGRITKHQETEPVIKSHFLGERSTLEHYIPISKSKCTICGGKNTNKLGRRFKTRLT